MQSDPLPPAWPPHRYEVLGEFPPPDGPVSEGYHFAAWAREAATKLHEGGRATRIVVIRLADTHVLFDSQQEIDTPLEDW